MKNQSPEIASFYHRIVLEFDRRLGSTAAETPVKFQSNRSILSQISCIRDFAQDFTRSRLISWNALWARSTHSFGITPLEPARYLPPRVIQININHVRVSFNWIKTCMGSILPSPSTCSLLADMRGLSLTILMPSAYILRNLYAT